MMDRGMEGHQMRLLAQCELEGRGNGGEGMGLVDRDGRRFLFIAHESAPRNLTVVDVSDPRQPSVVRTLDLPHADVRSNSLSISSSGELLAVAYQVRRPGLQPAGVELFDISTPAEPRPVGFFDTSGPFSRGTHFVWVVEDRAYLATGLPDFEPANQLDDQIVVVLDVADPARPREAGRWWLPGTRRGDAEPAPVRHPVHDLGHRAHNVNVYPSRPDRAYVGYLDAGVVVLDIADVARPRLVSRLDYHPPLPGFTHTVLPLLERGLLAVTDEAVVDDCGDHPKKLWVMDGSCETNVVPIATAPLPPVEEFRGRGGRFGAHNLHENDPTPTAWHSEDVLVGAFFGAGVRAYDIRDPFQPREIGYLMPPAPAGAVAAGGPSAPWAQMNDVYVDERGLIYAIDRFAGGLYVIELTGT